MSEHPSDMTTCGNCAFWRSPGGPSGTCRRSAPAAGHGAARVAHWPLTRPTEFCGDGVAAAGAPLRPTVCRDCRYWYRPAGTAGIEPMDRRDETRAWWMQAGLCVRHAPAPEPDSGYHGFWRATHATGGCAEGAPAHSGTVS